MYNDHLLSRLADTYQAEKIAAAEKARLLKLARAGRPVLHRRVLVWIGDRLIVVGWALKGRYEPDALNTVTKLSADRHFGPNLGLYSSQEVRR
jgi:hypothetical protein